MPVPGMEAISGVKFPSSLNGSHLHGAHELSDVLGGGVELSAEPHVSGEEVELWAET